MEPIVLENPGIGEEIRSDYDVEPDVPGFSEVEEDPLPLAAVTKSQKRYRAVCDMPAVGGKKPGAGLLVVYWSPHATNPNILVPNTAALQQAHRNDDGVVDGKTWSVSIFGIGHMAGRRRPMVPFSADPKPGCWSWPKAGLTHAELVKE